MGLYQVMRTGGEEVKVYQQDCATSIDSGQIGGLLLDVVLRFKLACLLVD